MLFRGTAEHPSAFDISRAIEYLGGNFNASTSPDTTALEMVLPPMSAADGLELLSEILRVPAFKDIDVERRVIVEEILEDLDERGSSVDIDFLSRSRLWPGHPLGQSVTGSIKNIEAFQIDDIIRHYRAHYVAGNAVLCISGAFDPDSVRSRAAEVFSDFPNSGATTISTKPALGMGPTVALVQKPGSQTQVRVAFHAPGEDDSDSVALATLLGVLDDGMSSRLHRRIFDERGLAYNLGASLDIYSDVGALNFDAATSHDNIVEVIAEILDIAKDLRAVRVPEDELEKARRRAAFGIEELMDDPLSMSLWYGEQHLFRTPPELSARVRDYLAVTAEDIERVARRVFTPQNLHVTTVGLKDARTRKAIERAISRFG
jgi:predicted Zn-dependent peptidase